ncbi:carnitine O-palmitoyltransferase liver isoform-like protein [Labeo rohita]|uniref:Carnitine O-palmitoyltransferase liver isoform-like protein n=1 Tax=Labeo rohita TaxID=84645 RepID=A0A498LEK8_LABRO|nr:carnitine O-palmitoyltransferase liver isoform-like protein [Labeo rohita]
MELTSEISCGEGLHLQVPWAKAHSQFFSQAKNKQSLNAVEKAAFFVTLDDTEQGYDAENPVWLLDSYTKSLIPGKCYYSSLKVVKALVYDVDMNIIPFSGFGKGLIKKCKISPDDFMQIALQLAHFRRLKSYTRNTMGQGRLSSLALLAIERTLVKSLEKTPSWILSAEFQLLGWSAVSAGQLWNLCFS